MTVETLLLSNASSAPPHTTTTEATNEEASSSTTTATTAPPTAKREEVKSKSNQQLFVWALLPTFCQEQDDLSSSSSYKCDLCDSVFSAEFGLKEHQLRRHINPVYLSEKDQGLLLLPPREEAKEVAEEEATPTKTPENGLEEEEGAVAPLDKGSSSSPVSAGKSESARDFEGLFR